MVAPLNNSGTDFASGRVLGWLVESSRLDDGYRMDRAWPKAHPRQISWTISAETLMEG